MATQSGAGLNQSDFDKISSLVTEVVKQLEEKLKKAAPTEFGDIAPVIPRDFTTSPNAIPDRNVFAPTGVAFGGGSPFPVNETAQTIRAGGALASNAVATLPQIVRAIQGIMGRGKLPAQPTANTGGPQVGRRTVSGVPTAPPPIAAVNPAGLGGARAAPTITREDIERLKRGIGGI